MSVEVTGPAACKNEGCAGWSGAEPQAWGTGHEEECTLGWAGHRQEAHRRGGGRGAARWRSAHLGSNGKYAGVGRSAGQEVGPGRARADGVLRGRAMRLRFVPSSGEQARREMPGRGAVDDAAATRRPGQDQPARRAEIGQAAVCAGADRGVGAGRRARGAARCGARPHDGGVELDALPPAHLQLPAAPGDLLYGQAVDQEAPALAGQARVRACRSSALAGRTAGGTRPTAGPARSADRPYPRAMPPTW
jgi:hypothetical protein